MRLPLLSVIAAAVLAGPAPARDFNVPPPATPAQMAVTSQVVFVGTVAAVEKEPVEAPSPFPDGVEGDAGEKVAHKYKVAVVKVEAGLSGADGLKEVRVGVVQPKAGERPGRDFELEKGQRLLLFLTKHPRADLYLTPHHINSIRAPIDLGTAGGKRALDEARRALAIAADPLTALKSEKAAERTEAAVILVMRYYGSAEYGIETEAAPVDAEESRLILKGLVEGEWKPVGRGPTRTDNPYHAFVLIPFGEHGGWADPLRTLPPNADYAAHSRATLAKWLAGPGKDFRLSKLVVKKDGKK